eukprot:scaffold49946_cov74-Phaeocystis_antarctica.AAC.3
MPSSSVAQDAHVTLPLRGAVGGACNQLRRLSAAGCRRRSSAPRTRACYTARATARTMTCCAPARRCGQRRSRTLPAGRCCCAASSGRRGP